MKEGDLATSVSSPRLKSVSVSEAGVTDGPVMIDDHEDEVITTTVETILRKTCCEH